jgi:hypothetical protein
MPFNLEAQHLAVMLRITTDATEPLDEPLATVLGQHTETAKAEISEYAGPDTPDAILNGALVQYVGALYEADPAPTNRTSGNLFIACGARAMLAFWHVSEAV